MTPEERCAAAASEMNEILKKYGCIINVAHNTESLNGKDGEVEIRTRVSIKTIAIEGWVPVDNPFAGIFGDLDVE